MTQHESPRLFAPRLPERPQLRVLGKARDIRTGTPVVYGQALIVDYLALVGPDFDRFSIQRRREKHRAYERMKQDILGGALLPPITLAVKPELVPQMLPQVETGDLGAIAQQLAVPNQVNILDGLQRTYILYDLFKDGVVFKENQSVLLEFWLERDLHHLIYRIIVLNAGQKPMSMRHQVELLVSVIRDKIQERVPQLELYTETDETRRRRSRRYALDRVSTAYQSFLTRTPEVTRENIVAQQLRADEILDSSEATLGEQFEMFLIFLREYARLDDEICRVYVTEHGDPPLPTGPNWFGSENVMNSFFAAVSDFGSNGDRLDRIRRAIERMHSHLVRSAPGQDPLGLHELQSIIVGFNPRKVNIGSATRRLLTASFKEYFRDEGETSLRDCWIKEG